MKTKYTVTLPDGSQSIRKSERTYTHAVALFHRKNLGFKTTPWSTEGKWIGAETIWGELVWEVVSFAKNELLAEKATARYKKWSQVEKIVVLTVNA
jgi:hypothetical protein